MWVSTNHFSKKSGCGRVCRVNVRTVGSVELHWTWVVAKKAISNYAQKIGENVEWFYLKNIFLL